MEKLVTDNTILLLSLKQMSLAFNEFIKSTLDDNNKPIKPSIQSISKARGYLPQYCSLSYKK